MIYTPVIAVSFEAPSAQHCGERERVVVREKIFPRT